MAGEYIEFNNNSEPAINDTNLNRLQQLIKQDIQGAVSGDTLPIGTIVPFGSDTIPNNWLLCDGSAVSRTTYQDLFNIIGTNYGAGDGFTTFGLPDLRGRTIVGKDDNDTDFDTLGETGGEKTHTLTIDEIPSHTHNIARGTSGGSYFGLSSYEEQNPPYITNTGSTGGGQAHNIMQPYQVQNYIIKAFQSSGVVADVVQVETTSDEDVYSCNYINDLQPVSLYQNTEGTTSSINLLNNISNYKYIEIFWTARYSNRAFSQKIFNNNNNSIETTLNYYEGGPSTTDSFLFFKNILISGTTLDIVSGSNQVGYINLNGQTTVMGEDRFLINKILGYK